jgi:hypothetical protein
MTDRDALAREMMAAFYQEFEPDIGISEWPDWQNVADIALAHIAAAYAEALEEAAVLCEVEADHWKKNGSHGNAFASVACACIIRGAALDPKS